MKATVILMIAIMPLYTMAQEREKGIRFEKAAGWQQIREKAKKENKYVFMDINASWCGPCKMMDKDVFTQEKVGDFFNERFISIKVQLDTSNNDDENTKRWYADARDINREYKVRSFPTFFFFSPNGDLVHKAERFQNGEELIARGTEALDSNRQYYTLQANYDRGVKNMGSLAYLARMAKAFDNNDLANRVAKEYTSGLKEEDMFTKDNIEFLSDFTGGSNDKSFRILYENRKKIDEVMGIKQYSHVLIEFIIAREEIDPILLATAKTSKLAPNWDSIYNTIVNKYDSQYADQTIVAAKVRWYGYRQNWPEFTRNMVAKINMNNRYEMDGFMLNNDSYAVFERSTNKEELNTCIRWMEKLFNERPEDARSGVLLDTYANLLYKVGRKPEAIDWQRKALGFDPENREIMDNLDKMRRDEPTWPTK